MSCFKAYDKDTGLEVTWHEVLLSPMDKQQREIIRNNLEIIKKIKHPSILSIIHSWYDENNLILYYITESICYDSIATRIINNSITPRVRVISRWAHSILEALVYLHSQNPPILHHSINLESIYTRPSTGTIKIIPPVINPFVLDFRSTSLQIRSFTAPERFFGINDPLSDIWSFGVLLVHLSTSKIPYEECNSPLSFLEKIRNYQPPLLKDIQEQSLIDLILKCFKPLNFRWSAEKLLKHEFFSLDFQTNSFKLSSNDSVEVLIPNKSLSSQEKIKLDEKNYTQTTSTPIIRNKPK